MRTSESSPPVYAILGSLVSWMEEKDGVPRTIHLLKKQDKFFLDDERYL